MWETGFVFHISMPRFCKDGRGAVVELISTGVASRATRLDGDRWLVLISEKEISFLELYRYIGSQLRRATDFKKILMVFGDGRVEMLTE